MKQVRDNYFSLFLEILPFEENKDNIPEELRNDIFNYEMNYFRLNQLNNAKISDISYQHNQNKIWERQNEIHFPPIVSIINPTRPLMIPSNVTDNRSVVINQENHSNSLSENHINFPIDPIPVDQNLK